jgi:hypothetical protein
MGKVGSVAVMTTNPKSTSAPSASELTSRCKTLPYIIKTELVLSSSDIVLINQSWHNNQERFSVKSKLIAANARLAFPSVSTGADMAEKQDGVRW